MGRVDTVVLDKTGTVTEGKPRVTDLLCAGGMTEDTLLSAAASLEKAFRAPAGRGHCGRGGKSAVLVLRPVSGFAAVAGGGVTARAEGTLLLAGNEAFMETSGVAVSEEMKSGAARLAEDGKTPLFIAAGTSLLGVIAVADVVKGGQRRRHCRPCGRWAATWCCSPATTSARRTPLPGRWASAGSSPGAATG